VSPARKKNENMCDRKTITIPLNLKFNNITKDQSPDSNEPLLHWETKTCYAA
jgi:hypothetical protein